MIHCGKKKVLIDCDVGVDDALALILAFHSPEIEVRAITGVHGNVPLHRVLVNIRKILSLIRPSDPPFLAAGADRPLQGDPVHAGSVHGEDGLGGYPIVPERRGVYWKEDPRSAAALIPETARRHPGEMTLIAVGPLTNLALGLEQDREGMKRLKQIVIMGGAVRTGGNITPHAEFNFFVDPLAARIVLEAGLPITLVPLDVTHQVFLTASLLGEKIGSCQDPFFKFMVQATRYDPPLQSFRENGNRFYLHDPLAIGVTIDSSLVVKERLALQIETRQGVFYGRVSEPTAGPEVDVCLGVDSKRFLSLFLSRLGGPSGRSGHPG